MTIHYIYCPLNNLLPANNVGNQSIKCPQEGDCYYWRSLSTWLYNTPSGQMNY